MKLFKTDKADPSPTGNTFACTTGKYAGQIFIIIEETSENLKALSIPTMENVYIPAESFKYGRNTGIIEHVEKLPRNVYEVSKAQFYHNEQAINTNN